MRIIRSILAPPAPRARLPARTGLILVLGLGAGLVLNAGAVHAEPPIQSAEDAFCRSEAKAQVFSAPDPLNLGLRELGRRIWASCMERSRKTKPHKSHRRRRHR